MAVGITWDKTNPLSQLSSSPLTHKAHGRPLQFSVSQVKARSPRRHKPWQPAALPARVSQLRGSNCCCHLPHPRGGHAPHRGRTRPSTPTVRVSMKALHSTPPTLPQASPGGSAVAPRSRCHAPRCPPCSGDAAGAAPLSLPQPRPPSPGGTRRRCPAGPETPRRRRRLPAAPCRSRTGCGRRAASRRPDAAGMPAGPREDPREWGEPQPVPGAPPRSPAPGAGCRPTPPSPPGTGPIPQQLRRPLLVSLPGPFTPRRPGESRPPQPRAAGCPRVGRGTRSLGGLRSVGRELPDGRGRPVGMRQPRAGKKVVPAGAAGNRTHPPARRLRRGRDSNSPSRREQQRRADTAQPRRCLAAAAANRSAQRGHASQ